MSNQITGAQIQKALDRLNDLTHAERLPCTRQPDGTYTQNAGTYYIEYGNGHQRVCKIEKDGSSNKPYDAIGTKREVFAAIHIYIEGIALGMKLTNDRIEADQKYMAR